MMETRFLRLSLCLLAMLWLTGCVKEPAPTPDSGETTVPDLSGFDWKTTRTVPVNVASDNGVLTPVYIYNGTKLVAAGFTPFQENITIPASCQTLTLSPYPIQSQAPARSMTRSSDQISFTAGDASRQTIHGLQDRHAYLNSEWKAWSALGYTWEYFVVNRWNAGWQPEQSSIVLDVNQPPYLKDNGELFFPHTCLWETCETNQSSGPVTHHPRQGTYLFEDLFPSMGDYDMNDFVAEENADYSVSASPLNKVVAAELLYKIKALSSGGTIAMAVRLPGLGSSSVETVEMYRVDAQGAETPYVCSNPSGLFTLQASGLEVSAADEVVIPLFDNAGPLLPASAQGKLFFNTVEEERGGFGEPVQIKVKIAFAPGREVSLSDFRTDVFIMPRIGESTLAQQRGREIHQTGIGYSAYMNTALFGTAADNSDAAADKCFRTKEGYVWGLYIETADFRHPLEKVKLDEAYPQFRTWTESLGAQAKDWYEHPQAGNVWSK